jgi:uncharacterized protein (TIGR03067 family)
MKHLLLIVVVGSLVAADNTKEDDAIKEELKKFEGTWVVESATANGEAAKGGPAEITFSSDMLSMKEGDGKERKGKITIDPTKNPKTIDFQPEEKKEDAPRQAIYELKGDTLKICIGRPDKGRPTEFSDKDQTLVTLKRKKS